MRLFTMSSVHKSAGLLNMPKWLTFTSIFIRLPAHFSWKISSQTHTIIGRSTSHSNCQIAKSRVDNRSMVYESYQCLYYASVPILPVLPKPLDFRQGFSSYICIYTDLQVIHSCIFVVPFNHSLCIFHLFWYLRREVDFKNSAHVPFFPLLVPIGPSAYSVDVPIIASAIEYIPTNNTK